MARRARTEDISVILEMFAATTMDGKERTVELETEPNEYRRWARIRGTGRDTIVEIFAKDLNGTEKEIDVTLRRCGR